MRLSALVSVLSLVAAPVLGAAPLAYFASGEEFYPVYSGDTVDAQEVGGRLLFNDGAEFAIESHSKLRVDEQTIEVLSGSLDAQHRTWSVGSTLHYGAGGAGQQQSSVAEDVPAGSQSVPFDGLGDFDDTAAILIASEIHCIESLSGTALGLSQPTATGFEAGTDIIQGPDVAAAFDSGDAEDFTSGECDLDSGLIPPTATAAGFSKGTQLAIGIGSAVGVGVAIIAIDDDDDPREPSTVIEASTPPF